MKLIHQGISYLLSGMDDRDMHVVATCFNRDTDVGANAHCLSSQCSGWHFMSKLQDETNLLRVVPCFLSGRVFHVGLSFLYKQLTLRSGRFLPRKKLLSL